MDEKLPAPCEHCRASGLRHGSVCEECQGKGYRLFINGSRTPERLKRPPHQWRDPKSGGEVLSCTILTCAPNDVMAELHDRMPVILAESDWPKWLGEGPASEDELLALLKPCPDDVLKIWPVGKAVGNVKNTGPQLAMPV
jgi:hypothetical protein